MLAVLLELLGYRIVYVGERVLIAEDKRRITVLPWKVIVFDPERLETHVYDSVLDAVRRHVSGDKRSDSLT